MNKKNSISNAHDQFFRTAMANKQVAREFLKTWLPGELCQLIDFEQMEMQSRSQINDLRQESEVDVLFKTTVDGHEAYLYLLLEHQSTPDVLMPFRLLKYLCNIIDQHLKTHGGNKIPLIYPTVIYHGKRKYPYSTNLADLVDAPKELVDRYFLKPFQLIDLGQIDDETLKQHAWSGVMEFALKHIFARDILPWLKEITGTLHQLDKTGGRDYIEIVLQYLLERGELSDREAFFNLIDTQISHEVGEKIMSLAEQLKEEGRIEGELKGEFKKSLEIARRMLEAGSDTVFIEKVTGLSLAQIKPLQKKI
ncbi:Rpn family recombination-promoting nuclease/putative transposase [Legionella geestiana]|uniref:Rpn family recombination-promoting nuclease/putative transposase n=1 Tax=Legionella geestiana TaxID=45065 RepID=UPI00109247BD|nr:Rpn family recombination-promoting nuclease/putative transposase [Legionella geestiana]QDQ40184.1 Rpn family recombination-promoting nuclease/putative transposase [Legionella geestiana]